MRRSRVPLAFVLAILLVAAASPLLHLPDPIHQDIAGRFAPPSAAHWLGQDELGRDVLSRLIWGGRVSLTVAAVSAAISGVLGTAIGVLGGFLRGIVELLALRSIDVVLCFPPLLLALLVVTLLGPGAGTLIMVLSVLYVPGFARVAYAGVLAIRSRDFVEAVRSLGAGRVRIMRLTILPNIAAGLLVQLSLTAASAVALEAGLSFLGLGVVPPTPSWGLMIGAARGVMDQAPILLLWPCLALAGTILALNALCDGLAADLQGHAPPPRLTRLRRLVVPRLPAAPPAPAAALLVHGLTIEIATPTGPVQAVRNVALQVAPGETLAIVGESGSGKSLTGLALMGLLPPGVGVAAGQAWLDGAEILRQPEPVLRRLRGKTCAMVFQDPMSSLNPVQRIGAQIEEAIAAHRPLPRRARAAEAIALLERVGIADPARRARNFPHELSGGMRQRVMIAMAIAHAPKVLIADEPTTALDVTIQAQVLELLAELRRTSGLALIFITHSLPVVAEIADRVAVMYAGVVVEDGPVAALFARPLHPYTAALLASAPRGGGALPEPIPGTVPPPDRLPAGCTFAPRCTLRTHDCETTPPPLAEVQPGRRSRCLRWEVLA